MYSSAQHTLETTASWFSGIALMIFIVIFIVGFSKLMTWGIITFWKLYSSLSMGSPFYSTQHIRDTMSNLQDRWKLRQKTTSPLKIANQALRRVHKVARISGIQLLDIGLLSYDGGTQPNVSRTETIPAYTTGLRPFVVINIAPKRDLHFTLKVTLIDGTEQVRFASEVRDYFRYGTNYFTPSLHLKMDSSQMSGDWSLCVSIDEKLFAQHNFSIASDVGVDFRPYLRSDGEIDEWLSKSAANAPIEQLSLEELLTDQNQHSDRSH